MDRDSLLDLMTTEDVVKIMADLGSDYIKDRNSDNLYFKTICHEGNKYKLQYFVESKLFMCYTECGSMSLYDVVMYAKTCDFQTAYQYLCQFKGVKHNRSKGIGLKKSEEQLEDLEFLERHLYQSTKSTISLPTYNESVIGVFDDYCPSQWIKEGISEDEMKFFGVKFYFNQMKAILTHRNLEGKIIGIRGRSFNHFDIENNKKYMPLTIQKLTYRHPTGLSLYGAYENISNIKRIKKVVLFEGEKSVMKYGSFYGRENNIALATLGTTMSSYQKNMILNMGVNEVIIAYDKQYLFSLIDSNDKKAIKEYNNYIKKLIKIYKLFENYCVVSVVFCNNDEDLEYKDAPIDQGKEIFDYLLMDRVTIESVEELEEELIVEI